ncbi:hypothetical protein FQR65_LT02162 [Abscondita terminalis]|nr:hypothetical protein FQR65_LT02162 [Abscondita terminalis]
MYVIVVTLTYALIFINALVKTNRSFHGNKMLPDRRYCGFQQKDDRLDSDNSTALDEFPWIVHIVFSDNDPNVDPYLNRCPGVLISNRYVLTSEYCGISPQSVNLGQYHSNKMVTCMNNSNLQDCNEPILQVPIEEEIHRFGDWHDFVLLRLARNLIFTDYIRPICLPLDDSEVIERNELVFSGWGAKNKSDVTKKRLKYKSTDVSKCYKLDQRDLEEAKSVVHVCLEPEENSGVLACAGDESGPLMYYTKRMQWFADSIITGIYSNSTVFDECSDKLPIGGIKITMDIMNGL